MFQSITTIQFWLAVFLSTVSGPLFAADVTPSPTPEAAWSLPHPQIIAALIGAFGAGLFALFIGFLAHRRETRAQDALWIRDKLFTVYSDCIYYLIKLSLSSTASPKVKKEVRQHFSEAQRFLNLLRGYHHSTPTAATELLARTQTLELASNDPLLMPKAAQQALDTVKRLFADDARIQVRTPRRMRKLG